MLNPSSTLLATCAQQVINGIMGASFVLLNYSTRCVRGSDAADNGMTLIPCQEDLNLLWMRGHELGVCRSHGDVLRGVILPPCLDLIGKCLGNLFLFPPRTPEFGISLQCLYEVVVLQRCLETVTENIILP